MKTIILGIGNPILSDDGVGIKIAQQIKERNPDLKVVETGGVGINLLDHVIGYDRLIIIDSIKTGDGTIGDIYKLDLDDLDASMDLTPSHGMNIATTLRLGHGLGYDTPAQIRIYAIEILDNTTFRESCTKEIERQIPTIAGKIMREEQLCAIHTLGSPLCQPLQNRPVSKPKPRRAR